MNMPSESRPHTVIYDPDAVAGLLSSVKSKETHRSIINAVLKLGERLEPPHMKPLQGFAAVGPRELRPKQGQK